MKHDSTRFEGLNFPQVLAAFNGKDSSHHRELHHRRKKAERKIAAAMHAQQKANDLLFEACCIMDGMDPKAGCASFSDDNPFKEIYNTISLATQKMWPLVTGCRYYMSRVNKKLQRERQQHEEDFEIGDYELNGADILYPTP